MRWSTLYATWVLIPILFSVVLVSLVRGAPAAQVTSFFEITDTSEPGSSDVENGSNVFNARPVLIGEIVTYSATVVIPEGPNDNVSLVVNIPAGMQYVTGSLNTTLNNDTGWSLPSTPPSGAPNPGDDLTINLDPFNNTDSDVNDETLDLSFGLIVNNVSGNQDGTNLAVDITTNANGSTVGTSAQRWVTVIEPNLTLNKQQRNAFNGPQITEGDAGDTVFYRIFVSNTGNAPAYDINLTDALPLDYVTFVGAGAITTGPSAGASVTNNPTPGPFGFQWPVIQPNVTVSVSVEMRIRNEVAPGEAWTNTADITYNSLPDANGSDNNVPGAAGASNGMRDGSGGVNNYVNSDTSNTITVPDLTVTKQVEHPSQTPAVDDPTILGGTSTAYQDSTGDPNTGVSEHDGSQVDIGIGEEFSYLLVVTFPEGTTYDVTMIDLTSPLGHNGGLQRRVIDMLSAEVVWVGANLTLESGLGNVGQTFTIEDSVNPADGDGTRSQLYIGGQRDVLNTPDGVTDDDDRYVIRIRARVDDETEPGGATYTSSGTTFTLNNRDGDVGGNRLQYQWNDQDGSTATRNVIARNDMVEPDLDISLTNDTGGTVDADDTVQFTITVENTGTAPAYNIVVVDEYPLEGLNGAIRFDTVDFGASSCDEITGFGINPLTPNLTTFDFEVLAQGNSCTIVLNTIVEPVVTPNQTYTYSARIDNYDSRPDGPVADDNRTYPATGVTISDTATFTTSEPSITLTYLGTSESHTDPGDTRTGANNANEIPLAVGEIIRYQYNLTLIEGTHESLQLTDDLPDGLEIIQDSNFTVTLPVSVNSTVGTLPSGATTAIYNDDGTVNAGGVDIGTTTLLRLLLGDITNPDTNNATDETIVVEFNALVLNNNPTNQNDRGNQRDNTGAFSEDGAFSSGTSNTFHARIYEPNVTVTKTANPTTADAGDTVTFTVEVTNDNNATGATAFDLNITDTLPAQFSNVIVTNNGGGTDNSSGNTIDITLASLAPNTTATITYTAQSLVSVTPTETVTNTATVTYTSLPGDFGTVGNSTGSDLSELNTNQGGHTSGADDGERTGSGSNENDYTDTNDADVTINNIIPSLSFAGTSEATTSDAEDGSSGNERPVAIGEVVTYAQAVILPEGTINDLALAQVIPTGLDFVAGTVRVYTNGVDNTVTFSDLGGTLPTTAASAASIPVDGDGTAPAAAGSHVDDGGTLYVNLGDIVNNDSDVNNEEVVVLFDAVVVNDNVTGDTDGDGVNNVGDIWNTSFDAQVGTNPAVTSNTVGVIVNEPAIVINKAINATLSNPGGTGPFDGGDTVVYDLEINNTGNATAFDINVTDAIDSNLNLNNPVTFVGVPATTTPTDNSDYAAPGQSVDVTIDQLQAGESMTIRVTTTVNDTVVIGQVIGNQADITYTSLPGAQGTGNATPGTSGATNGERNGNGTAPNDYSASSTTVNFTVGGTFDTVKSVGATSATHTTGADVAIGEVITYELEVTLMEGTTADLTLTDTLPAGLAYVSGSATLTLNSGDLSLSSGDLTLDDGDEVNVAGQTVTISLGEVVNSNANNDTDETLTVSIQAVTENVAGNTAGTLLGNTFTLLSDDADGTQQTRTTSANVDVNVVEPVVTVEKVLASPTGPAEADAGDTVTYRVNLSVTGADAFDINVTDALNTNLIRGSATLTDNGGYASIVSDNSNGAAGGTFDVTIDELQAGTPLQLTLTTTVATTVQLNDTISNTVSATYTSLPGTDANERTGDGTGENDYSTNDIVDENVTITGTATATKSVSATSAAHTTGSDVVVGEVITYELATTLPESSAPNLVLTDVLPANLEYVAGSAQVRHEADSAFTGSGEYGSNSATYTALPGSAVDFTANTLTLTLGQVINNDNDADAETLYITFEAVVVNTSANNAGSSIANGYTADLDNDSTPEATATDVTLTVQEPSVTVAKAIVGIPPSDAFEQVTYDLTLTAGSALNQTTAFDLRLQDPLYPDLSLNSVTLQTAPAYVSVATDNSTLGSGGSVDVTLNELRPGDSAVVRVVATVQATAFPGETISNTASLTYTSLPADSDPNERTGADGVGGALNDYADTSNTPSFTLANPAPTKSIVATSEGGTTEATNDDNTDPRPVVVGEIIRYQLLTVLPESANQTFEMDDVLPTGLDYIPGSARTSYEADTAPTFNGDFAGIQNESPPTFTFPASRVSFDGTTRELNFDFGQVINNDGDSNIERLIVEFDVLVTNTSANAINTDYGNDYNVVIDRGLSSETISGSNEVFVVVQEPAVSVTKTASTTTANPGDVVTYTLAITAGNGTNESDAYDLVLTDALPPEVTYVAGSAQAVSGVAPTSIDDSTAPTITFAYDSLQTGETSTVQLQAEVNFTTLPNTTVTNPATLTYTSLPGTGTAPNSTASTTPGASGAADGERNGNGTGENDYTASNTADLTTLQPNLTVTKAHVGNFTLGVNNTLTIDVRNQGPGFATDTITVTDTVPSELTLISAAGSGWTCGVVGQAITCTYPAPVAPGATLPTITATVNPNTTVGSPFINTAVVNTTGELDPADNTDDDPVTVANAPEPDLQVSKSHTGGFTVGQPGVFTLNVRNVGAAATTGDITVTDTLPTELDYVSAVGSSWACSYNSSTREVTCTRAAAEILAAGSTTPAITLTVNPNTETGSPFTNTVTVSTPGDTNTTNDTATDDVNVLPQGTADLTLTKTHSGNGTVGQDIAFTLTVANVGSAPTTGDITITDTLPTELDYVSATGTDWTCNFDATPREVTCVYNQAGAAAPLAVGNALPDVTLTANPNTETGSPFTNTASVSTPGETNMGNNSVTDTLIVTAGPEPDLSITKTAATSFVLSTDGDFTIQVENVGTSAATGTIQVVDTLPAELNFVSATGTDWTCTEAPVGTVTCDYTGAAPNGGASLPAITLTVNPNTATAPATVQNNVTVSSPDDNNTTNDTATADVTVTNTAEPDLSITKSHVGDFTATQDGTFTITVQNIGSADTTGALQVVDTLPTELTFVSATGTDWTCTEAPVGTVTCDYDAALLPLAAGDTLPEITLTVTPTTNAGEPFVNSVTVTTPGDANSANDTATDSVNVSPAPNTADVTITKTHPADFAVGTIGTYTIEVTNTNIAAIPAGTTLTVTDTLPGSFTYESATGTDWTCSVSSVDVTCETTTAAEIATNTALPPITLDVTPNIGGTFVNTVSVALAGDPNTANNSADDSTFVSGTTQPDLMVNKTHPSDFIIGGGPYDYTITIENAGSADYNGSVQVTDTFDPAFISYDSFSGTDWACTEAPVGTVTCDYQGGAAITLATGDSLPALILSVNAVSPGTFDNIAAVSDNGGNPPDTNIDNNTVTNTTDVLSTGSLVAPTGNSSVNASNDSLTWSFEWTNPNPTPNTATETRLEIPLPPEVSFETGSLSCTANNGSSNPVPNNTQASSCFYSAGNNLIIWTGRIATGADNSVELTFRTTIAPTVTTTSRAIHDGNDNGTLSDELDLAYNPPSDVGTPTIPGLIGALLAAQDAGYPLLTVPVAESLTYTPPAEPTADNNDGNGDTPAFADDQFITKRIDGKEVILAEIGDTFTYEVTVRNPLGFTIQPTITIAVDDRLDVIDVQTPLGQNVGTGNNVVINGFDFAPGVEAVIRITIRASERANSGEIIQEVATFSYNPTYTSNVTQITILAPETELPATGEPPLWRGWALVGLVIVAVTATVGGAYRRYRRLVG